MLFHNTTGVDNTGFGVAALYAATVGNGNTTSGSGALGNNTNGTDNTAVGRNAGLSNTTGSRNTLIGSDADANAGVYTNGTALGNGAVLTASNSIVLGNRSISRIFANVTTITGISDRRRKKDIKALDADLGLDFIEKLQPVSYRFNNGDETERYGFIAQDLEQALPTSLHDTIEKSEPEHGLALIERPTLQPAPSLRFSPAVLRNVPIRRSGPRAADAPVEGNGFEPSVPLETVFCDCWLSRSAMFISPKSPTARNGDGMFEYRTSDLT